MKTQLQRLEKLLLKGCTSMDIIRVCRTTTPTRRLSDCRENGWTITKVKVPGKNYHRFYGKAPKSQTKEQKRQQTSENRELQELQELQELLKEQLSKARFAVPDGKGYFFSSWREEALQ